MSWLNSSTWMMEHPPISTHLRPCLSSKPALRSIQTWGGLFDDSVTGDDLYSVAPAEKSLLDEKVAPFTPMLSDDCHALQEMLDILESDGTMPLLPSDDTALLSPTPTDGATTPPLASTCDLLGEENGMDFLEGFRNLDDYLFQSTPTEVLMDTTTTTTTVALASIPENAEMSVAVVSSTEGTKRKRTAAQAFADCVSPAPVNPDHCDYVCKKPRRSAATATMTVAPMDKDAKYRERRTKNNIASKRSREARKKKFSAMETREIELEASNAELEKRVVELEELTTKMKDVLVKRLSQAGSSSP